MPSSTFRVGSFNVENLFARPKVFNFRDKTIGDDLIERIAAFRRILAKSTYSAADKTKLRREFQDPGEGVRPLKDYILIREDRGKLWRTQSGRVTGVRARGAGDWDGSIEFKTAKFSDVGRANTGKVIRSIRADVLCVVEADDRPSLKKFDTDVLSSRYRYEMLLDGNDLRGIDVGLYSRFELGGVWTHMFDGSGSSRTFSRDCPEYEVFLPGGEPLYVLCNHLKSKGYGSTQSSNARRKRQAEAVAAILDLYDLTRDLVVVAGDLNDTPSSAPLAPLMQVANLFDALALQFPDEPSKRWTYHYDGFDQIDYLLVSKALKQRFVRAGVERRGIYDLERLTEADPDVETETEYPTVTHFTNAASDHAAIWAEFRL